MSLPVPNRPDDDERHRRHGLLHVLTRDPGLKLTALLLAVVLWLVVGVRKPTEEYVTVRVEPVIDSSLALLGGTPHVRALVSGRIADLVQLYAEPPVVRRAIAGDAPDTLMLDIAPSDIHLDPSLATRVRVLDVQPRGVMLRFATRAVQTLDVVNDGRVVVHGDSGATLPLRFEPARVRVSGPRGALRSLRAVRPLPLTIAAGDTLAHVVDLDTAGLGVHTSPSQVRVRVTRGGER